MSDKMREEFEAWISRSKVCISKGAMVEVRSDGHYTDGRVDLQWKAWKASRAALCVELPSAHELASDSCGIKEMVAFNFAISVVGEKLKSVGIVCK